MYKMMTIINNTILYRGLPGGKDGIETAYSVERPVFSPWIGKIPWRREWLPVQYSWDFHGGSDSKESGEGNGVIYTCKLDVFSFLLPKKKKKVIM